MPDGPIKRLPKVDAQGNPLPLRGGRPANKQTRHPKKGSGRRNSGKHGPAARTYDRLKRVQDLLTLCYTSGEIRHTLAEEWQCSPETISKYIAEVYANWKREALCDDDERRRTAESLAKVFQMAVKTGEHQGAIRALEIRSRILGLYKEKINVAQVVNVIQQNAAESMDLTDAPDEVLAWFAKKAEAKLLDGPKVAASPTRFVGDAEVIEK